MSINNSKHDLLFLEKKKGTLKIIQGPFLLKSGIALCSGYQKDYTFMFCSTICLSFSTT